MTSVWAARIPVRQSASLGLLRLVPDLQAAFTETAVWIRGPQSEDAVARVRLIPHAELFHVDENDGLRPWCGLLKSGTLPDIRFRSLAEQTLPQIPQARWPSARVSRIRLTLVRSEDLRPATILETSLSEWAAWGLSAPRVRLRRWTFAAADNGRALVRGAPLPPLPGQQYWESGDVAIPVGWECSPNISGAVLTDVAAPEPGGLVLLSPDGSADAIPATAFAAATRSALRATLAQVSQAVSETGGGDVDDG